MLFSTQQELINMNNLNSYLQYNQSTNAIFKSNLIKSKKVLIVSDHEGTQEITELLPINKNFTITICNDGMKAIREVQSVQYHLILLDIVISNLNGFKLLKKLRSNNNPPIMMFSSHDDLFDKIYALEMGADDYFIKPVNPREVMARINSIIRRSDIVHSLQHNQTLNSNDISLCLSTREVQCCGSILNLTKYEFEVLYFLILNVGEIVSKDRISEYIHGRSLDYYDRSIDMHISNIRKKIAEFFLDQKIKTVRGSGYVFLKAAK